jgi:MSHA pilin protein MshA
MQKRSCDVNFFLPLIKINGFTLVELIMVIVILGILSSFALPKFSNLISTAEQGTIEGAVANVKSAAGITHTKWLIADNNPATIDLEGQTIDMVNGYPSANIAALNGNIAIAAGLEDAEWEKTNPSAINKMSVTFKSYCFTYTEAVSVGSEPSISSVQAAPCL